jgi:hypothetical protein
VFEQLAEGDSWAHQRWLACGIHTMNGKDEVGEIDARG